MNTQNSATAAARQPQRRTNYFRRGAANKQREAEQHATAQNPTQGDRARERGGRKRIIAQHPLECPTCEGFGYTRESSPEFISDEVGRLVTVSIGSGCTTCCGVGRLKNAPLPTTR